MRDGDRLIGSMPKKRDGYRLMRVDAEEEDQLCADGSVPMEVSMDDRSTRDDTSRHGRKDRTTLSAKHEREDRFEDRLCAEGLKKGSAACRRMETKQSVSRIDASCQEKKKATIDGDRYGGMKKKDP